jgi:hypothetical protein
MQKRPLFNRITDSGWLRQVTNLLRYNLVLELALRTCPAVEEVKMRNASRDALAVFHYQLEPAVPIIQLSRQLIR